MSKLILFVTLVLLFAVAQGQRSKKSAVLLGACALVLCVSQARAQTRPQTESSTTVDSNGRTVDKYLERDHSSRFDLGINFPGLVGGATGATGNFGGGVRMSVQDSGHLLGLDGEVDYFPAKRASTPFRGGTMTQMLIGPKINFFTGDYNERPFNHCYLKLRPGFVSWSNAVTRLDPAAPGTSSNGLSVVPTQFGRVFVPALDLGISLEAPLGKGFAWRVDAGDTFIYSSDLRVAGSSLAVPAPVHSNFQMSTGIIYRFKWGSAY